MSFKASEHAANSDDDGVDATNPNMNNGVVAQYVAPPPVKGRRFSNYGLP